MGAEMREPRFEYGGFIMNDRAQAVAAIERFRSGQMGHLEPAN
jgi:redox-sensitive bicupin YhaK (pirin superfamily)